MLSENTVTSATRFHRRDVDLVSSRPVSIFPGASISTPAAVKSPGGVYVSCGEFLVCSGRFWQSNTLRRGGTRRACCATIRAHMR